MDLSIAIRVTKERIITVLNESGLSYDVEAYILDEILKAVKDLADQNYKQQLKRMQEKAENTGKDTTDGSSL